MILVRARRRIRAAIAVDLGAPSIVGAEGERGTKREAAALRRAG
jgi:hypothetical protein